MAIPYQKLKDPRTYLARSDPQKVRDAVRGPGMGAKGSQSRSKPAEAGQN
jgi:hypothetical protein